MPESAWSLLKPTCVVLASGDRWVFIPATLTRKIKSLPGVSGENGPMTVCGTHKPLLSSVGYFKSMSNKDSRILVPFTYCTEGNVYS